MLKSSSRLCGGESWVGPLGKIIVSTVFISNAMGIFFNERPHRSPFFLFEETLKSMQ